jgi:hypothetical protein
MNSTSTREDGYYWIRIGAVWEVAHYVQRYKGWMLVGQSDVISREKESTMLHEIIEEKLKHPIRTV